MRSVQRIKYGAAYSYFDFPAQNEESPGGVLSALLKQVVRGMEEAPKERTPKSKTRGKLLLEGDRNLLILSK